MSFKSRPQSSSRRPTISAPLESHVRPPQSQFAAATLFPRAEFPASAYPDDDDALPPPSPAFNNFSAPNSPFQASPTFFADSPDLPHPDIATPGLSGAAGQYAPFRKHASAQEEHGLPVDIEAMSATGSHCGSPEALTSRLGPPLAHRATTPTIPFPSLGTDETSRTKPLPPTLARSASATLTTNSIEGLGINMGPPIKDPAIDSLAALQTDIGPRSTTSDQSEVQQQPVRPSLGPMELPARPDTPSSGSGPGGHSRRPSSLQRTRSRVSSLTTDPSDEMPGGTPRGRKESLATIETEVTSLNLQFVKQLLSQVLLQSGLKPEDWEQTLLHLLIQVTKTVRTLPRPENIDVSRHVKVKKLPGGRPKHCEYVDGLVFTKNLLRKQMPREKKRPRLMLLSYPIEYQRQDQLSSLAPIIHQEKIYLSNLVERITALRPHIVLVDQAVSGRAVDYLADRGIAVARNVKPSVMKALSRAFNTEIISSLDQLSLRPSLGRCETFQVQTFVHNMIPGKRKTLLRFEGTHRDIVSTLILRGGDLSTLGRVKDVVRFMIKVAFNLRMESFLFHDEHVSVLNPPSLTYQLPERAIDGDFQGDTDLNEEKLPDNSASDSVSRALQPYLSRILSNTPFTVFSPPYPLLQMKLEDSNLRHIRYLYDHEEAQRILREELECRQADSSADSSVLQCPPLADGSPPVSRAFELGNALSRSASQHSLDSIGGLPSSSRPAFAGTYAALAITSPLSKVPEVSSLAAQLERAQDQHATTLTVSAKC